MNIFRLIGICSAGVVFSSTIGMASYSLTAIQVELSDVFAELNQQLDRVSDKSSSQAVVPEIERIAKKYSDIVGRLAFPESLIPPTGPEVQALYEIQKKIEVNRRLVFKNIMRIHERDLGTQDFEKALSVFQPSNPTVHSEDVALAVISALVEAVEAMNDQLEMVTSLKSAKAATPSIKTIGRQLVELNRRFANPKIVGKPATPEMAARRLPYEEELIDQQQRLEKNAQRLKDLELVTPAIQKVLEAIM
jgi:hypothetical protein